MHAGGKAGMSVRVCACLRGYGLPVSGRLSVYMSACVAIYGVGVHAHAHKATCVHHICNLHMPRCTQTLIARWSRRATATARQASTSMAELRRRFQVWS